jgi:hypothetical protein
MQGPVSKQQFIYDDIQPIYLYKIITIYEAPQLLLQASI